MWSNDTTGRELTRPMVVAKAFECMVEMLNVMRENMVSSA
jgi:hypothetical protein